MATDAGGTRPLTALVAGNGQSSVSYQLPAGLLQYVQSIVATIDTSSSGDVSPLLTIRDDANIVVADKQQNQAIDAGGSGRATWALRLTDETVAAGSVASVEVLYNSTGEVVNATSTKALQWKHTSGSHLLNLTTPDTPSVKTAGLYVVTASAIVAATPGPFAAGLNLSLELVFSAFVFPAGFVDVFQWDGGASALKGLSVTTPAQVGAGEVMQAVAGNDQAAGGTFRLQAVVARVA